MKGFLQTSINALADYNLHLQETKFLVLV